MTVAGNGENPTGAIGDGQTGTAAGGGANASGSIGDGSYLSGSIGNGSDISGTVLIPPTLVQQQKASNATSLTLTSTPTPGNIIVIVGTLALGTTMTVADSLSNALTQELTLPNNGAAAVFLFDYIVPGGGVTNVFTFSNTFGRVVGYEISGSAGVGANALYASNGGTAITSIVITQAGVQTGDIQIGTCASNVTAGTMSGTYSNGTTVEDITAVNKMWIGHGIAASTVSSTLTGTEASTSGAYQGLYADYTGVP